MLVFRGVKPAQESSPQEETSGNLKSQAFHLNITGILLAKLFLVATKHIFYYRNWGEKPEDHEDLLKPNTYPPVN